MPRKYKRSDSWQKQKAPSGVEGVDLCNCEKKSVDGNRKEGTRPLRKRSGGNKDTRGGNGIKSCELFTEPGRSTTSSTNSAG